MEGDPPRHPAWIEKDQTREGDVRRCEAPGRGVRARGRVFPDFYCAGAHLVAEPTSPCESAKCAARRGIAA